MSGLITNPLQAALFSKVVHTHGEAGVNISDNGAGTSGGNSGGDIHVDTSDGNIRVDTAGGGSGGNILGDTFAYSACT